MRRSSSGPAELSEPRRPTAVSTKVSRNIERSRKNRKTGYGDVSNLVKGLPLDAENPPCAGHVASSYHIVIAP